MAKELKSQNEVLSEIKFDNETETVKVVENGVVNEQEQEIEEIETNLFVELKVNKNRETGKSYRNYFVTMNIRNHEHRAELIPADKGGYEWLDSLYDGVDKLPLNVKTTKYKDKLDKIVSNYTYSVSCEDEFDGTLVADLRPKNITDSEKLKNFINIVKHRKSIKKSV